MEKPMRHSKQRDKLRELMQGRIDHPDAQKIYEELRSYYPSVSLGTVYRNLMLLSEDGEIQALHVGDGKVHFDPNTMPHAHFLCRECHEVSDMDITCKPEPTAKQLEHFHGEISGCSVTFVGVCEHCLQKLHPQAV